MVAVDIVIIIIHLIDKCLIIRGHFRRSNDNKESILHKKYHSVVSGKKLMWRVGF